MSPQKPCAVTCSFTLYQCHLRLTGRDKPNSVGLCRYNSHHELIAFASPEMETTWATLLQIYIWTPTATHKWKSTFLLRQTSVLHHDNSQKNTMPFQGADVCPKKLRYAGFVLK